jgi:hypothetical protein
VRAPAATSPAAGPVDEGLGCRAAAAAVTALARESDARARAVALAFPDAAAAAAVGANLPAAASGPRVCENGCFGRAAAAAVVAERKLRRN